MTSIAYDSDLSDPMVDDMTSSYVFAFMAFLATVVFSSLAMLVLY